PARALPRPTSPAIHARASRASRTIAASPSCQLSRISPPSWSGSGGSSSRAPARPCPRSARREPLVPALADQPPLVEWERRLVLEGRGQHLAQIVQRRQLGERLGDRRGLNRGGD